MSHDDLLHHLRNAEERHRREPGDVEIIREICRTNVALLREDAVLPWTEAGLALTPHDPEFVGLRVDALNLAGLHIEAAELLLQERSLPWSPAMLQLKLGHSLMMGGRLNDAIGLLNEARQIASVQNPARLAKATHLLGEALLKRGDASGFALWTARIGDVEAGGTTSYQAVDIPIWDSEQDLRGKRLLITHQLGFGDQFLLAACMRDFQSAGATVMLTTDLQIHTLMRASLPDVTVICADRPPEMGGALPENILSEVAAFAPDFQMPLLGAPLLGARQGAAAFRFHPYLRPPAEMQHVAAEWAGRLRALHPGKKLVGLFWDCQQRHEPELGSAMRCWAARRSIPLELIDQLVLDPAVSERVQFVNLQHPLLELNAGVPAGNVVRYAPGIYHFDDTAACVDQLDAVISVDSGVANLAALMCKPTCVAVNTSGDWRWGSEGTTTPWIDAVTVLRQTTEGDWQPVMRAIADWLLLR